MPAWFLVSVRDDAGWSGLHSIDVSRCAQLKFLDCGYNSLTSLDLAGCPNLIYLDCSYNMLLAIDISPCPNLTTLRCQENRISDLSAVQDRVNAGLTCTMFPQRGSEGQTADGFVYELKDMGSGSYGVLVYDYAGTLSNLVVPGMIEGYPVTEVSLYGKSLASLDLSQCTSLRTAGCVRNGLASLVLPRTDTLRTVLCYGNDLTVLDVSGCPNLREINCDSGVAVIGA